MGSGIMYLKKSKRIVKIKKVDISKIKSFLETLSENDWNAWNLRQKNFDVHKDTKTYPLLWSLNAENGNLVVYKKNVESEIWNILKPEFDYLSKKYKGKIVKCMFALLPPNGKIEEHWDSDDILMSSYRIHLPIKTNKNVNFFINNKIYSFKEGIAYEFNNQLLHSVENNSLDDRIHLLFDVLPDSQNINVLYTTINVY
jgi:aspartyl/asparaginyl beta-hydroxylase (cupin superfamily)